MDRHQRDRVVRVASVAVGGGGALAARRVALLDRAFPPPGQTVSEAKDGHDHPVKEPQSTQRE